MTAPEGYNDRNLTSGAEAVLSEYLEDIRGEIVLQAVVLRRTSGPITASDIVHSIERAEPRPRFVRPASTRRLSTAYIAIGGAVAVLGLGTWIVLQLSASGSSTEQIPLLAATSGLIISALGAAYARLGSGRHREHLMLQQQEASETRTAAQLIIAWRAIEIASRQRVTFELGESHADRPIHEVVREASRLAGLTEHEKATLDDLRALRNSVAHRTDTQLEPESVPRLLDAARRIEDKLRTSGNGASLG